METLHDPLGNTGKLLLRPEEAAELLSIGRSKVYELIGTGELRSVRIGVSRRIPADALLDFVAQLSRRLSGSTAPQEPA
ncbi:MAG TPA: helix-turn-helix domain-containing protein [Acidimicrobiia bacterium]|nr:helix-turn-helix domain-containing protein [Acidimicrobiia bacterium]